MASPASAHETASDLGQVFAERLKQAQEEAGLRSEDVARAVGVSLRTYTYWRQGREPKPGQRVALARYFGKDPRWFFGLEDGR